MSELREFPWLLENLLFLDEVGFDNLSMLRNKGWGVLGKRLYYRGESTRQARVSCLAFLGVNGAVDVYTTEGTFTRLVYMRYCMNFATKNQQVSIEIL